MSGSPAWSTVASRLAVELGEPVRFAGDLGRARPDRTTWAAEAGGLGELIVKVRRGDRAEEKTSWCAANLPLLGSRGYPVPTIIWHGPIETQWHGVVQRRLPGVPLKSLDFTVLDAVLELIELQADAGIDAGARDFAAYQAYVLFEGWDHVWRDAEAASPEAELLCARLRRWLQPVWGHRLPARDFAHNDLNLTNILSDGATITGVVDWDEFALNTRGADLTSLAFDCERSAAPGSSNHSSAASTFLERIAEIAGEDGLRCLVSYRAIGHIAALERRHEREAVGGAVSIAERVLDTLGVT